MESGLIRAFALDFRYTARLGTGTSVRAGPLTARVGEAATWRDGDRSGLVGRRLRVLVRTSNTTLIELLIDGFFGGS